MNKQTITEESAHFVRAVARQDPYPTVGRIEIMPGGVGTSEELAASEVIGVMGMYALGFDPYRKLKRREESGSRPELLYGTARNLSSIVEEGRNPYEEMITTDQTLFLSIHATF